MLVFSTSYMPWIFFTLATVALVIVPWLDRLSARFEKQSSAVKSLINIVLVVLVVFHILREAYFSSGVHTFFFAFNGLAVACGISRLSKAMSVQPWPVLPVTMIFAVSLHGLFDGFAFRMSYPFDLSPAQDLSASGGFKFLSSIGLVFAVLLHRIPESLLIWRLSKKLINQKTAILALAFFGLTTFIGLTLSDELMSQARPVYINVSYFQVFIAGSLLYATIENTLFKTHSSS